MSKLTILIFIVFLGFSASGKGRVVLLVSLDPDKNRPPLRTKNWNINKKLKAIFFKKLKKIDHELVYIPYVRQTQLRKELLNPDNRAVFWVGHSNKEDGMISSGLYDDRGFNMKEVFQDIHQNINFLGLVGCRSLQFVNSLKKDGHWKLNSHLKTYSKLKKTDARKGLKKAIKAFLKSRSLQAPICIEKSFVKVKIERESTRDLTPIRIIRNGELMATFSKGQREAFMYISKGLSNKQLKLVVETGAPNYYSLNRFNIGKLTFSTEENDFNWSLFANKDGEAIGHGTHVYLFSGSIDDSLITNKYLPIQCISK